MIAQTCRSSRRRLSPWLAAILAATLSLASASAQSTNVVNGAISVAGEQDTFVFNLPTSAIYYFDVLTNVAPVRWSLSGPPGLVAARAFSGTDGQNIGDPLLRLPAGDYTLTIDCNSDEVSGYAFRFVDLSSAALIVPGTVVSGTLAPANETDFYQFTATAGDRFVFDQISRVNLPNCYWRLVDPYGGISFSGGFADFGTVAAPVTLIASGTYTLMIEGYYGDTGSGTYSFNVSPQGNTPLVPFSGTALAIGNLIVSNLVANTTNSYIFTLASPARLMFDSQTNSPNLTWTLEGPPGIVVNQRGLNSSDGLNYAGSPLDLPAGDYQLRIRGNVATPYRFRLLDVSTAIAMTLGTPVSGSLNPATETDLYQFSASAGDEIFLDATSSTGIPNAYWKLLDPFGGVVFNQNHGSDGARRTLGAAGTYTLALEGYIAESGNGSYSFNVVRIADGAQALTLGNVVDGAITSPGQLQNYSFSVGTSTRLYFDSLTNVSLRWSLRGPTGTLVNNRGFSSSDGLNNSTPLVSVTPGDYTLTVSGSGDNVGNYRFRLFDVATAAAMNPGTPVSGTLNPARETDAYAFTLATAGTYYLDGQGVFGLPNAYQRLIDAHGNIYVNGNLGNDVGPITLPAGNYLLLVEGYHSDLGNGNYTFNLAATSDTTQTLTAGNLVAGGINSPGQVHNYTFTLPSAARLYFDVLTNSPHRWSLSGPTGLIVNNRGFSSSDSRNIGNPLLELAPGNYTLAISLAGDNTGPYAFRLLDTASATPITPGNNVASTLVPATETDIYSFSLAAVGEYFFDGRGVTGAPSAQQRLIDSHGNFYVNTTLGNDVGPVTLPAGDYIVLVEGYYNETGNGSYAFNVTPVADGTQPLTVGTLTSGAITGPGQTQSYTFTIPAGPPAWISFDAQTNAAVRWSLSGPTGVIVNNRTFISSDGRNGTSLFPLPAGDYTLTISASDDTVAGYRFRLFDTATATAITPGTAITATLDPPNETDAYRFTLAAPTRVFFDVESVTSAIGSAQKRLVDAYGNFYVNNALSTDAGPLTLPAGDYVVLIEGNHSETVIGSYTFNVAPVNDGTQPLAIGSAISGTISAPGQTQVYTFTVPIATRLHFDSLTNTSQLRWSLAGPTGALVNNRAFNTSDAQSVSDPVLALPAGDYRLTVSGEGDATAAYQFYLHDFAAATVLTPGTPVTTNNFPANTSHLYRFTAAAGDRFFFDHQAVTGLPTLYWRLVDPYNGIVFARRLNSDAGTNVLGPAGTYTLLVEGYIGDTGQGSYTFDVRPEGNVPPPTFTGTPITIGAVVGGNLAASTTTNAYTFSLAAPSHLSFDVLTNAPFRWTLQGPPGLIVDNRNFQASDGWEANSFLNLPAGNYQLTVSGAAGGYQFRLLDFASAMAYTPGTLITNTLAPGRSTALFKFTGAAGQQMFFDGRPISGFGHPVTARLYAPLGNLIVDLSIVDDAQTFTLLQSGPYTLAIEGRVSENAASGTYSFNLQPVSHTTNALTIGTTTSGDLTTVGQTHYYTFTLPSAARLYFDALTQNSFFWQLQAVRGEIVPWRSFNNSDANDITDPVIALEAGTYTLAVAAQNFAFTGSYQFRLLDLAAGAVYTPGVSVTNTLSPARSTSLYRFAGVAGQRVFFDGRTTSGFTYQPYVRLIAPLGNIIMAEHVNIDVQTFTLPQSGTYTLTVEGRIFDANATGNYAFNLQPVTNATNALTIGALTGGSITTVGEAHVYTFSLASAARLYFDALTNSDFYWRLDAPWGEVIPWRSFTRSDSVDIAHSILALEPASYTLTVAYNNFADTGSYQFRLLDFANATPFSPGTVVSDALAPNRSTALYQFTANAGDKMYFDGRPSSGFSQQPQTRIYAPLGNIVLENAVNTDAITFTLPQSGTYALTVEGRIQDNGASGNYAFNLQPVAYPTNALTMGATTSGTISTVGQAHYYTFDLAMPARLYFDALTYSPSSDFYWRLDARAGSPSAWRQVVDWRAFGNSDAGEFANPLLALEAGSYVLAVAPNNFSFTGDYQFRLLDFGSATPITPGTIVNGSLAPNRSTVFYRFNASAGDRFYFDGRPTSGFNNQPYVRLYAPLGNVVVEQNINTDVDTFSVPQSGNYVVTVEGRIYDPGTNGTYSFNFVPNPIQPEQPLFETNNSPDLIVSAVSVSPASGLQSGDSATVHWTVQNAGNVATAGSFTDRVTVRNTATSQIIVNSTLAYNEGGAGSGPIGPGATRLRQLNITLPDGTNGTGNLEVTVTTDALNNILELNSGGTGEANNSTSTTITTTLAPYPDLLVHSVTTTPPTGWLPGSPVTIAWRLTNAGPRAANRDWVDSVVIRNTNTAYVFATTTNYVVSETGNGALAPNDVRDRGFTFVVPNNDNAYGGFEITVTTDSGAQVFELNGQGSAETNNSRSTTVRNAPDLRILALNATGSPALRSGANLTVSWNTRNEGRVETGGQFSDRVVIRNNTIAETLLDTTVSYNPATAGNGPIPPGESRARSRSFQLPDGVRGAGEIEVVVTADTSNQLLELNAEGTGEANNSAATSVTSAVAPYPDLQVVNVTVEPSQIGGGTNITVRWQNTNSGSATTSSSWHDRVTVVNTNNGLTLLDASVFYNASSAGPLTNGTARNRSHNFTLPNNSNSAGGLVFTVTADQFNTVFEHNASGTAEANNAASIFRSSALTPLPDLAVHTIVAPAGGAAGQSAQLVYVVTNRGTATATGPWADSVYLSSDSIIGADYFFGSFGVLAGTSIPAGASISRTQSVVVPVSGDAGDLHFVVVTDSGNAVLEQTDANNSLLDADNFNVPPALTLTLSANQIAENAINPNIAGTVTRNGSRTAALTVNLLSSDSTEIVVPANVVIGVGQVTANFTATVQQDGVYDGDQGVTVTANAPAFPSIGTNITVLEGNVPFLSLDLAATNVVEGAGILATITRDPVSASPLAVLVTSSDPAQLSGPSTVEIPGGVASVTFTITAIEDTLVERTNSYTLTASTPGFNSDSASVRVMDNDIPDLLVVLDSHTISEGAGPNATSGRVIRSFPGGRGLVVGLLSGNTSAALVPGSVTIPAGATSAVFTVSAVNDSLVDGTQAAAIGAGVLETGTSFVLRQGTPDVLSVTDDDGPTLTLVIATDLVGEGRNPATTATVTRNTATGSPLEVTLLSSDTDEATVPPTVTIPAGALSAIFNIASVADGTTDGNQTVAISASASGYTIGSDTLVVSDADLPDLVIASLISTNRAYTGETIDGEVVLDNRGLIAANGSFAQRLFVSSDQFLGNDTLGAQVSYSGVFPVSNLVEQTFSVRMPANPGNYWLIAQADVNDSIIEALENNNMLVSASPIIVESAYAVTVSTDVTTALANTAVPISGRATMRSTGTPAASVPVTVHLEVRGVRRTFSVVTAGDGSFSLVFQPLPNEAGIYRLAAAHPGVSNPPSQDTFTLIGMSVGAVGFVNVVEGETESGSTRIENLSDVPLNSLNITVVTNPPNLSVVASVNTNRLGGFATATLDYHITANDASYIQGPVVLRVTSAEGASAEFVALVRVEALRPRLVAIPSSLRAEMQRGSQATVTFTLANQGGVPTGPLEVIAPGQLWLSIASLTQLDPLPPGSNVIVTVLLTPPSDLPLADYNGNLVVRSTNSAISVPFSFRAVSAAKGSMFVTAEDEYTYFATGGPRVTNATVVLTDALSGLPVVTNRTGSDGTILFTNLTEAYYTVDVRADGHGPFRESALVSAGNTTNVVAFLARETVRYSFVVTPTTVEDRYTFEVESTFETQVPVPVVTISPASLDLSQYPENDFQVQFTIANHGLITADRVALDIPSSDTLEVTPLIEELGRLAANTSLTVPVRFRRVGAGAAVAASTDTARQQSSGLSAQCAIAAQLLWDYVCGPNVVNRETAFYMFDARGCNINEIYDQVYTRVPLPTPHTQFPYGSVPISQVYQDFLDLYQPMVAHLNPPFWRFQCRPNRPPGPSPLGQSATVSRASQAATPPPTEVCARVSLRLDQRAVLARDAFRASLEIANETTDPITNLRVDLDIKDGSGAVVNSLFGIRAPELSGISGVDGTGAIGANTTGNATWILIPSLDAAPTNGQSLYLVGGTISYDQAGSTITVPLAAAPIQVFPQPELVVRYFHERDVFSDDPFTPEVEPSVPYSLAVQVANVGYGAARSLKLTGGKPQIIENEKGLLIEFRTLATQLENQSINPALEVDFGRIEPNSNKVARWIFTSSVQGNFTNFSANFAHQDALGVQRLSLVRSVEIHELTHIVQAGGTFHDGRPDLLVNDVQDADRFPDTIYLSDNTTAPVLPVTAVTVNGTVEPGSLSVTINAGTSAGWNYIRFGNPASADYRLTQVRRSDNTIVPLGTNVWTTDRFFRGGEVRPIRTNQVHLLDYNSDGVYTLSYAPASVANDTNAPISFVEALPANNPPEITVRWNGDDGTNGSGIVQFNVYVSVNGGAFTPWVTNTLLTAAIYTGTPGNTYRFYSRAVDAAGNMEQEPGSPDAQTAVVSAVNSAPSFASVAVQTVVEGSPFSFTPNVTDSDVPAQTVTFSLLPGAPAGTLLTPTTGRILWSTSESDGGTTNTFRIVVTDNGSPALSATQSVVLRVTEVNSSPVITTAVSHFTVDEQSASTIPLGVSDGDVPAQSLTWQIISGAPVGLGLDPATGLISWTPSEEQAPSTNTITVQVRDNGNPMLSDSRTLTILVNEVNRAPTLAAIADHTASVLQTLSVTAAATDPDAPTNRLTYTLDPGAPAGARITRGGEFTWTPSRAQALSSRQITVRVTDNGLPALSDTKTFTVNVGNYFDVALGSTFVLAGQTGSVDIAVTATLPTTNASFTLDLPVPGLRSLTLPPAAPPLASATMQQLTPNSYRITLTTLDGQPLTGSRSISSLQFVASTNEPSAFIPLEVADVSAIKDDGQPFLPTVGDHGRVIFINGAPLLELGTNPVQLDLTIYAEPAPSYSLQTSAGMMPPLAWSTLWTGSISNSIQVVLPPPTNNAGFYRATRP